MKSARALMSSVLLAIAASANAGVLSSTVSLGRIGDTDTDPGVPFTFTLGGTFSSITSVTFVFDPCNGCGDTIGTAEDVILNLGPDTFTIGNVGLGATITATLAISAGLANDLLDGTVSGLIWMHEQANFNFPAGVDSADITLTVDGRDGTVVPIPGTAALLALGLTALGLRRRRS